MMKLKEFTEDLGQMNKEELELHMLSILESMNKTLNETNQRFMAEHGTNRKSNQNILPKHSPAV